MAKKLNYDTQALLNFKFKPSDKGYDALEVDQVFDRIIEDYNAFVESYNELSKKYAKQDETLKALKEQYDRVTFELASEKRKLEALRKKSNINDDNYTLITKVANYERVLHRKGVDLKKAQTDPDNC